MSAIAKDAKKKNVENESEITLLNVSMKLLEERSTLLQSLEKTILPVITKLMTTNEKLEQDLLPIQTWMVDQLKNGKVELPGSSVNDTRLTGWLEKKGGAMGRKWQRRWCKLWGQELYYYAEDNGLRLKGQLDLNGCTCESNGEDKDGNFLFVVKANDNKTIKKSSSMKFQTREKKKYSFRANSEDNMKLWIDAIKRVSFHPDISRDIEYRNLFLDFKNSKYKSMGRKSAYLNAVREISTSSHHTPIVVPCDWLHQQMIRLNRTKSVERDQEEHEHLSENRDVAKSLDQVYKDLKRDKINLNGEKFVCPEGSKILDILYNLIMDNRTGPKGIDSTTNPMRHAQDARDAIAFARTILLGSVRTVCGGEAYDAVSFMFHDTELVMICPDPTQTHPLKLTVQRPDPFAEQDTFSLETPNKVFGLLEVRDGNGSPIASSDGLRSLKRSQTMQPSRNESGGRKSHYSQLHEKWASSPKKKSLGGKSKTAPNLLIRSGSDVGTGNTFALKGVNSATTWPEVIIEAESTFKIMSMDPEDEVDFEPYAFVKATFRRKFVWGRHTYLKPASVILIVTDNVNKKKNERKLRMKNHNSWSGNMAEKELREKEVIENEVVV